jgi:hypothetical protein
VQCGRGWRRTRAFARDRKGPAGNECAVHQEGADRGVEFGVDLGLVKPLSLRRGDWSLVKPQTLDWSNLVVKPRTGHTSESEARGWSNYPSLRRGCRNLVGSVAPCSFSSWLGCLHDWELSFAVCLQILLGAFPGELVGTLL